jgi:tripartite motif-containing protein 2/3/tripartite motif-containing protein 71
MSFSPDGELLWVADSCNHRIQGVDPLTGEQIREIGGGWLRYPYGVAALPDGSIVVTEFGGHRLSLWSPEGTRLGAWGGWGRGPGRLRMPWGVAYDAAGDLVHVLDTGNARVLSMPRSVLKAEP